MKFTIFNNGKELFLCVTTSERLVALTVVGVVAPEAVDLLVRFAAVLGF